MKYYSVIVLLLISITCSYLYSNELSIKDMTSGNKRVKTYSRNGNIILKITEDNKNNIKEDIVIGKNIIMTLLGTLDNNKQNITTIATYHSDYDIFMSYDKDVIKSETREVR